MNKRSAEAKLAVPFAFPIRLHLRSDLHLTRKLWHMSMGLLVVLVYTLSGMSRGTGVLILGSILGLDLMLETLRLRVPSINERVVRFMGPVMRSCEVNRVSGTPYYISAMILAIAIFPQPIAILSILYLAFGDPIASVFGILYGDRSIRMSNGKSLVGSAAGVLTCMLVTAVFLSGYHLPESTVLALTAIGGIAGGCAELLPLEVDDNFSIPIISGFGLWLAFILLTI
jgi:diacylglycerol kinase (CTP)